MVIGEAGSGKSSALIILRKAMLLLESQPPKVQPNVAKTKPQSLTKGVSWYGELKLSKVPERGQATAPGITWHGIDSITINPRAVTFEQLYGRFNDVTNEWTDGLVPLHFRALVSRLVLCLKECDGVRALH